MSGWQSRHDRFTTNSSFGTPNGVARLSSLFGSPCGQVGGRSELFTPKSIYDKGRSFVPTVFPRGTICSESLHMYRLASSN